MLKFIFNLMMVLTTTAFLAAIVLNLQACSPSSANNQSEPANNGIWTEFYVVHTNGDTVMYYHWYKNTNNEHRIEPYLEAGCLFWGYGNDKGVCCDLRSFTMKHFHIPVTKKSEVEVKNDPNGVKSEVTKKPTES